MANNAESETRRVPGPGLTAAVRRYPAVVLALAVLGGVLGAGVSLVRPPAYSASARLVLGAETDVNVYRNLPGLAGPARAEAAATALGSVEVREEASKTLGGDPTAKQIQRAVTIVPADNAPVVTVTATRSSASSAAKVATAVARSYVTVSNAQTKARGDRAQAALRKQITSTRAELAGVQAQRARRADRVEAGFASVESLAERARLSQGALRVDPIYTGLTDRAAEVSASITALRETLDQTKVDDSLAVEGMDTLYPAAVPTRSVSATLLRNTLAGLVLGIVLGVVAAWLLLERRRSTDEEPATRLSRVAAPAEETEEESRSADIRPVARRPRPRRSSAASR